MANKRDLNEQSAPSLRIGTHDGNFHCDEILACFMLQQLDKYANSQIVRTRNPELLKRCDIVVDVGGIYNAKDLRFDHHQNTFNETLNTLRPDIEGNYSIRLSSAGLIFVHFGEDVIQSVLKKHEFSSLDADSLKIVYTKLYENLIAEIDAIDNGVPLCDGDPKYRIMTHLSARVGNLYPAWNSDKTYDEDKLFEQAKTLVGLEFTDKVLYFVKSWLPAREFVEAALQNTSKTREIIELSRPCPWKEHLFDLEKTHGIVGVTKYVLMENKDNDWRVICVPLTPTSFICRKFLHENWRGASADQIVEFSGIIDATFCHSTGFIGGAKSREGVYKMALQSLNGNYID